MSDGIDKKLRNKKLELRQNIIENSSNHAVKPCFKQYLGILGTFIYIEKPNESKIITYDLNN